jgi:cytochrome c peroxidase
MKNLFTFLLAVAFIWLFASKMAMAQGPSSTNGDLTPIEELGKKLFFDKIADPDNMACADCHAPQVGFVGPIPGINKKGSVYPGAVPQRFGNRKPPSAAYATTAPIFHYDETEGLFIGGNFWDGRATGEHLGNPAADQALGPFLNPVEQNNASKLAVLKQVGKSKYSYLWMEVWGEPLMYETAAQIDLNYDRVGLAIAAYEGSTEVNQFSSKFDYYLQGLVDLTPLEIEGMNLFNGAGMCNLCHISDPGPNGEPPLFTDYTFDNLGTPKNPDNPFYDMDEIYLPGGFPINPEGDAWIDPGLGGFLETHPNPAWQAMAADNMGKHKVPTLRNIDLRPGNGFTKAYLHNGVFKSLKEVVNFYNTRDVGMWPPPEVAENVNTDELGDLGLTGAQEDAIVAFMQTLSDGYKLSKTTLVETTIVNQPLELKITGINPFSYNTKLSYNLPEGANVEVSIFNLAGEKVQTLVSGQMEAGEYQVELYADNLKNGVYIVRLKAGSESLTKKITLIN